MSLKGSATLSRRFILALGAMLLPLVAVAGAGVLTFHSSVEALEEFRAEALGESRPIERVRRLLVEAKVLGEDYVEDGSRQTGREFDAARVEIDEGFVALQSLNAPGERDQVNMARIRWERAVAAIDIALSLPKSIREGRLDDFHDPIDEAGKLISDVYTLNVDQVASEIVTSQEHERSQLLIALAILVVSSLAAASMGTRVYRSITRPLAGLEEAAVAFGSDELSFRIAVKGDDELARVSRAFNLMAEKLGETRKALQAQALHDPLTGLPNRRLFIERLDHAIARSDRGKTPFSVLYLDLDGLKTVNDTMGHEAGDEVLVAVSARLSASLRAEDTAARLGGDEFAVLLEGADVDGAAKKAQRLSQMFATRLSAATTEVTVAVSIGVATRRNGELLDELLGQADTAMYAAKASGGGGWQAFSTGMGYLPTSSAVVPKSGVTEAVAVA